MNCGHPSTDWQDVCDVQVCGSCYLQELMDADIVKLMQGVPKNDGVEYTTDNHGHLVRKDRS